MFAPATSLQLPTFADRCRLCCGITFRWRRSCPMAIRDRRLRKVDLRAGAGRRIPPRDQALRRTKANKNKLQEADAKAHAIGVSTDMRIDARLVRRLIEWHWLLAPWSRQQPGRDASHAVPVDSKQSSLWKWEAQSSLPIRKAQTL